MRLLPLAILAALAAPAARAETAPDATTLDRVVVTASTSRLPQGDRALPSTITVITREQLEAQFAVTTDLSTVLANLVPGFSPSRQKLSGFGETLRGRSPLYLVDGVPQSSPLRDGSRDGYTIDPAMIERIEVLHGANALQGLGASGGLINIITRRAPEDGTSQRVELGVSAPTDGASDGLGGRGSWLVGHDAGALDVVAGASWQERGLYYDGEGRAIGVDSTQGDLQDSHQWNLFAKLGLQLDDERRLQLMANRFELQGEGDYVAVAGSIAAGRPTTSVRGVQPGTPPRNRILTTTLDYSDADAGGGALRAQLFHQRTRELFGGGTFATFQDPSLPAGFFDQSQNESDKSGARLDWSRRGLADGRLSVLLGLDALEDTTAQSLAQSGRLWVPETRYRGWAPFAQAEWLLGERVALSGGLRREHGDLEVATFRTLAFYNGVSVDGGSPSFEETLANAGVVVDVTDAFNVYASVAEGYGLPDVGRVLRAINVPGQDVDTFLDLTPVVADNRELGAAFDDGTWRLRVARWWSSSDLGALLVFDAANQSYSVARERTELQGWELAAGWRPFAGTEFGLDWASTDGRSDRDGDGRVDSDLDGANISPDRVVLSWTQSLGDAFSSRLQVARNGSRRFERLGAQVAAFDGYTTLDALLRWDTGRHGELTLGVENLLDRQYITYYSQTLGTNATWFAGRGRTASLAWTRTF